MRRMELRHLRYFAAVAGKLSFTKAAATLRVAQPALSRQIRQLEEEVGVRLLERNQRQVSLTPAGAAFLKEAQQILDQSERAVKSAQLSGGAEPPTLHLGYVWGLFHTSAPALLAAFRRRHPEVPVHFLDLTATQQAAALSEGTLDAGFIGLAEEADLAGLAKQKVGTCEFVAALPKGHPQARKPRVALGDLADDLFIAISEASYPAASHFLSEACGRAGFRPRILQAAERGFTALGLVAANCGVALLPAALKALPHKGVIFRPLVAPLKADLFLAWNPKKESALTGLFRAQVKRGA